jgi:hypothetical protein
MCSRLGINDVAVLRYSCARPDICIELRKFCGRQQARSSLLEWAQKFKDEYILIVCTTIADATDIAVALKCPLTASTTSHEDDTLVERFRIRKCVVGTSRACTGLDLIELRRVAIFGQPFSAEHILQASGRLRRPGTVTLFFFKESCSHNDEICEVIAKSTCGADMLSKIQLLVDGDDLQCPGHYDTSQSSLTECKDYLGLQQHIPEAVANPAQIASTRLKRIKHQLNILEGIVNMKITCCNLCFILTGEIIEHESINCHRLYNICLHCFGHHASKHCPKMPKLGRMCYKCFIPLDPVSGISFHQEVLTGQKCTHVAIGILKGLCMLVHCSRIEIPGISVQGDFFHWLLQRSEHVPNVLRILEFALQKCHCLKQ